MNLNLNFSNQNEYNINESLVDEMINLYGVKIKLLITEKINQDENVFGDFSHMKSDEDSIFPMMVLPEESEDFSTDGYSFSPFGIGSFDNVVLFISKATLSIDTFLVDEVVDFRLLQSQLIIFPNNKIMEITDVDPCVPGVNNLFTNGNEKSVYKLTCVPYAPKIITELDPEHLVAPEVDDYDFSTDFGDIEDSTEYETTYETVLDGIELVTNGEFDDELGAEWVFNEDITGEIVDGALLTSSVSANSLSCYQLISSDLEIGETYQISANILSYSYKPRVYVSSNADDINDLCDLNVGGESSTDFVATTTECYIRPIANSANVTQTTDSISLQKYITIETTVEVEDTDVIETTDSYETLDNFFDTLEGIKTDQDTEVKSLSDYADVEFTTEEDEEEEDTQEQTILVDETVENIWGDFE